MARRGGPLGSDSYRLIADLNQEWSELGGDCGEVESWAARHLALRGCQIPQAVLDAVPADPDGVLGALIRESEAGSTLAARTVLQAMLGKVVLMAAADPETGVQAYVVAMWERIRTYPLNRRPRHISANLALDARKFARREGRWTAIDRPWPPGVGFTDLVDRQVIRDSIDHASEVSLLTAGDVIKAALELELIDGEASSLLTAVYADGLSSAEAGRRHVLSAEVVRQRCSRVIRQLAQHSDDLATFA